MLPVETPFKPVVLIPVYNHEHAVGAVVDAVLHHGLPCLLVDDGSTADCAAVLRDLAHRHAGSVKLMRLPENQGKGGAVMAGLAECERLGFTHAVQLDADGQHDAGSLPRMTALARQHPHAMVCGHPVYDASVPRGRLLGRYLTHVWVWIHTLSLTIKDSMCGMRVYPLCAAVPLVRQVKLGRRMEFDIEVLVHLVWRNVPIINVPVDVTYPADGVSHFRIWRDNVLISGTHVRLFFGMLRRLPWLLARKAGLA